ncbi:MAG TPA: NAD+ synthase [Candidatus Polarisedimenticolia bacterium]|nr:NAD+ synthase [Candidatus Polarisedimenticolia bacterium]
MRLRINAQLTRALLVDFIRRETLRSGFQRVVLGVSGGIDSAVVLALAVEALGSGSVVGAMLPYRTSHPSSLRDAETVLCRYRARSVRIDITPMVDAYLTRFPDADRRRRGNKMARERMSILYDLSAIHEGLVLGTSNKSELLLGYGTLHGDMASALNPLGDLYKTQVRQLARHLGLPERLVRKHPTADLWQGQTDEKELGFTYSELDRLLYFLVDLRGQPEEAARLGFPRPMVRHVREMIRRSQYKRRLPLIAKVSNRTIGVDFRYPRDWGV